MAKHFNFVDIAELRYRKRYDLLQWQKNTSSWLSKPSYDTANGMICCNSYPDLCDCRSNGGYDTANGMICCNLLFALIRGECSKLRYRERYDLLQLGNTNLFI